MKLLIILFIAVSLSMDTFSLSLGIGTYASENKSIKWFPVIVGIFHFFMPYLGFLLSLTFKKYIDINSDIILSAILIFIAIEMIIDLFSKEEKNFNINWLLMVFYAFSVSIDSFSLGLALTSITNYIFFSCLIFAICAALFTYAGLKLGKYAYQTWGYKSKIIGLIIILFILIIQLFF